MNKNEKLMYQAQDDAYTMARYAEIMQDRARANRAAKVAAPQARNLEAQAKNMKQASKIKTSPKKK